MGEHYSMRDIACLDLAQFNRPEIMGNRGKVVRAAWYLINALIFNSQILALLPSRFKATILRAFGAKVGDGLVCKPLVSIKYPWFLQLGDNVWLGQGVWIDNLCDVSIGSNVCISQGARIFTGNHDWGDPYFKFFSSKVEVGDGVWITAFQTLRPGASVPPGVAVVSGTKSSYRKDFGAHRGKVGMDGEPSGPVPQ